MDRKNWRDAVLCLATLLPPLIVPGLGVLGSGLMVLLVLIFMRSARSPALALRYRGWLMSLAIGLVAGLAIAIGFDWIIEPMIEGAAGEDVALEVFEQIEGNLPAYLIMLVLAMLFGGVVEELIFRGYVIGWGSAIFGPRAGPVLALLSAAVFGFAHLYQGWAGVIVTGSIGLIFGVIYLITDRKLLPVMIAHATVNAYGVTQLYLGSA